MNFKIPQNVTLEDRIFAFITMKQLIILVIGFGVAYLIFIEMNKLGYLAPAWGPIISFVCITTILIAFVKINFLPFHLWIILLISKFIVPQKRYWMNNLCGAFYYDLLITGFKSSNTKQENINTKSKNLNFDEMITKLGVSSENKNNNVIYFDKEDNILTN